MSNFANTLNQRLCPTFMLSPCASKVRVKAARRMLAKLTSAAADADAELCLSAKKIALRRR